jgi:hypothetical protein
MARLIGQELIDKLEVCYCIFLNKLLIGTERAIQQHDRDTH